MSFHRSYSNRSNGSSVFRLLIAAAVVCMAGIASVGAAQSPESYAAKLSIENTIETRLYKMIADIAGPQNCAVSVKVQLSDDRGESEGKSRTILFFPVFR
jgi:flagellar biosynthesis/type III secretory pathway M-ring protein FliF/YscJ